MSYKDDLDAALSQNEALRKELDQLRTGVKKRGFARRHPALITILSIVVYLFTAGVFYTIWRQPQMGEDRDADDAMKTGAMSVMWPITATYKLGAIIARGIVGKEYPGR